MVDLGSGAGKRGRDDSTGHDDNVRTNGTRWLEIKSKIKEGFSVPMPETESALLKLQAREDTRARC